MQLYSRFIYPADPAARSYPGKFMSLQRQERLGMPYNSQANLNRVHSQPSSTVISHHQAVERFAVSRLLCLPMLILNYDPANRE
jgi:hypothetical protein